MMNSNTATLDTIIDQPDWGKEIDALASRTASHDAWHDRKSLYDFPQFFTQSKEERVQQYINLHRCSMNVPDPILFAERYAFWYDVFLNRAN